MLLEKKTTQAASRLLARAGNRMPYFRLLKLLYIADREAIRLWGGPISFDRYAALKHGPILGDTYDAIKSEIPAPFWTAHIHRKDKYDVVLVADPGDGELSDAEVELLDRIHEKFEGFDQWAIRDMLHEICPEWRDPGESSFPIAFEDIVEALGFPAEKQSVIVDDYRESSAHFRMMARARHVQ